MGILNEFSLWPWMLGRPPLAVPVEDILEDTIRMFLRNYRRPQSGAAGNDAAA